MKKVLVMTAIAITLLSVVAGCQETKSKNWLIGKWKLDETKEHSPLIKRLFGNGTTEWTEDKYNNLNNTCTYKTTEISPKKITFKYKIMQDDATEVWYKKQDGTIYLRGPSGKIAVHLIKVQ
jgi:hypothetical protein